MARNVLLHCNIKAILERILLNYGKKITTELVVVKNLKKTGFPGGSDGKTSVYNTGDLGSIPGLGRSPGEGNGNPLQDYCLENPMDRGAWRAMVCRVAKSWTRLKQLSTQGMLISCFRYSLSSLVAQTVKHLSTMRETRVRSLDWEDPLEKELAIHSRTIAWKIPWTEKPGRL